MNLGIVDKGSPRQRGWLRLFGISGFAAVLGAFGLVGVHPAEGRAEAAPAGADGTPAVDLPVPPRRLMTDAAGTVTPPATAAIETTTPTTGSPAESAAPPPPAPAPPPVSTAPNPPAPAPAPAPPRPAVVATGPQAQAQVEGIADSSGWNWRAAGVRFNLGFYPPDCCHWGVYESARSTIWIGPTAFEDPNRLRYVVLHELAHAWQYRQNRFGQFITDYTPWGFTTIGPALEAGADCVANVWGAAGGHYWNCPAEARALAARRLAGDWR